MIPIHRLRVLVALFGMLGALTACSRPSWQLVRPETTIPSIEWSPEEEKLDYAIHNMGGTQEASYHVVRVRTTEGPHFHDRHDLVVSITRGKIRVHLGERTVIAKVGDIIEIPRGTLHWVENLSDPASEAYAIFTPPFDGKDRRPADLS